jgi:DNA topoisomerase IB
VSTSSRARSRHRGARLRRSDCSLPGIARVRHGRGFRYLDEESGTPVDPETRERIEELAIPPAWREVWICADPWGHLQATGIDAAGRKQYLYHDRWRARRDRQKFDEMLDFARALPLLRETASAHLAESGVTRERVLAAAVRLLDRGFFRIGSEEYAENHGTYGLATMEKRHVRCLGGGVLRFDYTAKYGHRRIQSLIDPVVYELIGELKRRRGGGDELLAYRDGRRWRDVSANDINSYIQDVIGEPYSSKDFRTWNATVLAAVGLAVSSRTRGSATGRKRAKVRVVREVANYLGNTPAVARSSYIDPRVFDRFDAGATIAPVLAELDPPEPDDVATPRAVEEAVLDLLEA